jgi:hypothetical protein
MTRMHPQPVSPITLCAFAVALAISTAAYAQTAAGLQNLVKKGDTGAGGIAANNPWFVAGAQVAHRFGTEGEFASNLLAGGQFLHEIKLDRPSSCGDGSGQGGNTGDVQDPTNPANTRKANASVQNQAVPNICKFHLPVVSTFGGKIGPDTAKDKLEEQVKDLLSTASGVTAGLFPYFELNPGSKNVLVTVHGLFAWRYNALKPLGDSSASSSGQTSSAPAGGGGSGSGTQQEAELVPLHQLKTGVGIEFAIGDRSNRGQPAGLTVSVSPVLTIFTDKAAYKKIFGEERQRLSGLEFVTIIPVSDKGVGVVIEGVAAEDGKRSFRAGLMLAAKGGS